MTMTILKPNSGKKAVIDNNNTAGYYEVSFWVDGSCIDAGYQYKTLKGARNKAEEVKK